MTAPLRVTTQAALDTALAEGVTDLIVDAPGGAYLEIRGGGLVRTWDSSRVVAWGSSRVEAWGSSRVVAWGSSRVVACDSSRVEACDSSHVEAWGSSRVEARDSSHVEAWGSSHVEARDSSHVEARDSSHVEAGRWTAVHLWSQRVTLTGHGHIIDMTTVDLTDVETWRAYVGADALVSPDRDRLIVGHVSSQDHEGRLDRDGTITIGCFAGTVAKLRKLAVSSRWPSHADAGKREKYRPRLLAFADLCEQQIEAWAEVKP